MYTIMQEMKRQSIFDTGYKDAWGWCMGMIQRDDMGWEVGGGFRTGNSCTPVVDSCQCMVKTNTAL